MRGLSRLAAAPAAAAAAASRQSLLCSSHALSSFSGAGGGGRGRGRGSGPPSPPPPSAPGQSRSPSADNEDAFVPPGIGHGRGVVLPSSPVLPSFSSWVSSAPPSSGRGRGRGVLPQSPDPDAPDSLSKKPIFFRRDDSDATPEKAQFSDPVEAAPLPRSIAPIIPGAGRGKPSKPVEPGPSPSEENRHLRPRAAPRRATEPSTQPKLGREEAVRKAMEVLSRGGPAGRGGRVGRGGRGVAGGRGRGGRGGRRGRYDAADDLELYVGNNADGEKLEKRLGEANMNKLVEGFEDLSSRVLPSPAEEAYLDALHTNNLIEYEPEYLVQFDTNPDIDEKPPMPLREYLDKMKPFLMAYEGIQSHEEWEEIITELLEKVPVMKELMDMYCGPDRVTAKQQQEELERVAKTLPENIPSSVKRFTDRALLSLQSNPGWGFDKKCQFMDKLVWEVSQQYK